MKKFFIRSMMCPHCREKGLPIGGENLAVFMGNSFSVIQGATLMRGEFAGKGITPHLIIGIKIYPKRNIVSYTSRCMIDGCGFILKENLITTPADYDDVEWLFKDSLIDYQANTIQLMGILDRLKTTEIKDIVDEIKEIKYSILQVVGQYNNILANNFSPGIYTVLYPTNYKPRKHRVGLKDWEELEGNNEGLFPRVFKEI